MKALLAGLKDATGVLVFAATMLGIWWFIEAFARVVALAH